MAVLTLSEILRNLFSKPKSSRREDDMAKIGASVIPKGSQAQPKASEPMFGRPGSSEQKLLQQAIENARRGIVDRTGTGRTTFESGAVIDRSRSGNRELMSPYGTGSVSYAPPKAGATIEGKPLNQWFQERANMGDQVRVAQRGGGAYAPEPGYAGTPMSGLNEMFWNEAARRMAPGNAGTPMPQSDQNRMFAEMRKRMKPKKA